ncbi:hypothetical protein B566_EDAN001877 [Ephemera danica]|nr:hypothetical protein B566_EDAN001877 [Ephemera danica]
MNGQNKRAEFPQQQTRTYQIIKPENYDAVMQHMRRNFFIDEPLTAYLNLAPETHEEVTLNVLEKGLSLMAVSQDGQILGVVTNHVSYHESIENLEQIVLDLETKNPALYIDLSLLLHIEKQCDIHRRYSVEKSFEVIFLSVDRDYRGLGIATELLQAAKQLAQKLELPIMHINCFSEFSARAAHKLGWQKICSVRYDQFRLPNYEEPPLMGVPPPHMEAKTYLCSLKQSNK